MDVQSYELHLYGGFLNAKHRLACKLCDSLGEPLAKSLFNPLDVDVQAVLVSNVSISPHPGIFIAQQGDAIERYTRERGHLHAFVIIIDIEHVDFFEHTALDGVVRLVRQFGTAVLSTFALAFTGVSCSCEYEGQASHIARLLAARAALPQVPKIPWYGVEDNSPHGIEHLLKWVTARPAVCTRIGAWDNAQVGDLLPTSLPSLRLKADAPFCVIDQEPIENGDLVCLLPCAHIFHEKCIKDYFKRIAHPQCPLDRIPVPRHVANNLIAFRYSK